MEAPRIVFLAIVFGVLCGATGWSLSRSLVSEARRRYKYGVAFFGVLALEILWEVVTGDDWTEFARSLLFDSLIVIVLWLFEERQWLLSAYERDRLHRDRTRF